MTWESRQQQSVSLSTTEAEYVAACETSRQIAWLRNLLQDVGIVQKAPTPLFCDNQGAFILVKILKTISVPNILMFSIIMFGKATQRG